MCSSDLEEAWRFWPAKPAESVFLWDLPAPDPRWTDEALAARWTEALALRERVTKKIEEARAAKQVGKSLDAKVVLPAAAPALEGLDLAELFIVSQVERGAGAEIVVSKAEGAKCPRCWRWQTDVGSVPAVPELCGRCARQL